MDRKMRAGVIGVGAFGSLHARVYSELESAELVAVADVNEECLSSVTARLGVEGYGDYNQLLERDDIDIVNICTTDKLHLEPVTAAARAGKHVLVEKPLASSVEDCDTMIQAASSAGVKLMVGQILRFDPRYHETYRAIEQGQIGDLVHVYTRRSNGVSSARGRADKTSVLFFLGIHDIYFVNWCARSEVEVAYGLSNTKVLEEFDTPDSTLALLKYKSGMIAFSGVFVDPSRLVPGQNRSALPSGRNRRGDQSGRREPKRRGVRVDARQCSRNVLCSRCGGYRSRNTER